MYTTNRFACTKQRKPALICETMLFIRTYELHRCTTLMYGIYWKPWNHDELNDNKIERVFLFYHSPWRILISFNSLMYKRIIFFGQIRPIRCFGAKTDVFGLKKTLLLFWDRTKYILSTSWWWWLPLTLVYVGRRRGGRWRGSRSLRGGERCWLRGNGATQSARCRTIWKKGLQWGGLGKRGLRIVADFWPDSPGLSSATSQTLYTCCNRDLTHFSRLTLKWEWDTKNGNGTLPMVLKLRPKK